MADNEIEVSADIRADAKRLYDMVSDLPSMGQWSPENQGGRWIGGSGPEVGARFLGRNRSGWRRWATIAKVTDAEPGKRFAFHVSAAGMGVADWSYEFAAAGDKTVVTERWVDRRSGLMSRLSNVLIGVDDRAEHNRKNMEATLAALKSSAEAK